MMLSAAILATLILLSLLGLLAGVRRGVVALAGTLLGAVMVDLWQDRWATWVREVLAPERPALPTFMITASLFVLVALLVGYGGGGLLPARSPQQRKPLLDRPLGALVGGLNAALIVSYLLNYARGIWPAGATEELIASSALAGILDAWLPWFVLAMVGTTGVFVLLRTTMLISRGMRTRPGAAAPPPPIPTPRPAVAPRPPAAAPPAGLPTAAPIPPSAQARSTAEAERRILERIDQSQKRD